VVRDKNGSVRETSAFRSSPFFVEIAWDKTPPKVAMLVCNEFQGRNLDGQVLSNGVKLAGSERSKVLAQSIRRRYQAYPLDSLSEAAVLDWACSAAGKEAFVALRGKQQAVELAEK